MAEVQAVSQLPEKIAFLQIVSTFVRTSCNQVLYRKNITKAQNFDMLNCHRCKIVKSLTIQHITILDIKSENFEGFFGLAETVHSLSEQQFDEGFDDPVVIDVIIVVNCQKCGKAHRCNSINCEKCDR